MRTINEQITALHIERSSLERDVLSINPKLELAGRLKVKIAELDAKIADLEEKRAPTMPYNAPLGVATIPTTSKKLVGVKAS